MTIDNFHHVKDRQTADISAERASMPFEAVSAESPCSKCGSSTEEDFLCCKSCGESILHGQEHFYPSEGEDEADTFCLCESCDEFGPPSEEEILFVRHFGVARTTECHDLSGQDQNGYFPKPAPEVVVRLTALWKDSINFQQGWAALLSGFAASKAYVARVGDSVEMVAEFLDADEAVRFTVHLESVTGAKASLKRTTVN